MGMSHTCATCQKSFGSAKGLKSHLEAKGHSTFKCRRCREVFELYYLLKRHYATEHDQQPSKNYCWSCRKSFKTRRDLQRHNAASAHKHNTPFSCPSCPSRFKTQIALSQHLQSKGHGSESTQTPDIPSTPETLPYRPVIPCFNGSKFECYLCPKTFISAHLLGTHLSSLHGIQIYECPNCMTEFSIFPSLVDHVQIASCQCPLALDDEALDDEENDALVTAFDSLAL
ncbi:hypothetical protein AMATHDRAFT_67594 [Amanita thiersii Skay4041]|uniref:C2H2-type domain-containing protein n=1 Tax=Amanita thiersii Skay4041 TaxID=703135 RepID=A0A2A9NIM7_9AGAR|nr:hypothetical protein AMATHDRAFT_67594 [Amanita thiersii Skay4041]